MSKRALVVLIAFNLLLVAIHALRFARERDLDGMVWTLLAITTACLNFHCLVNEEHTDEKDR